MIPQSKPDVTEQDFAYIQRIISSGQVAQGPLVDELETAFCCELGIAHSVAVANGTCALHLALLALNVGEGDEVVLPSYACASLLHAIHYTGAAPVLCDIDPETLNVTPRTIKERVTSRTRAVIVTHTFGFPADLTAILQLGLPVIEDCAQALGALSGGRCVGTVGVISVFSFYATKVICSGEGGMVCTSSAQLAARVRDLICPDMQNDYKVRYNYKLSDLAAGLALSQLVRLGDLIARRRHLAEVYGQRLDVGVKIQGQRRIDNSEPIYYRFVVMADAAEALMTAAAEQGVVCDRPIFRPLHKYGDDPGGIVDTEWVWKRAVSLPLYPALTDAEADKVVDVVKHYI
jgi:perosamine synthetase